MTVPRGIRNRNPGNVEYGTFAKSCGAIGSDGRFAVMATMADGIAMLCKLLIAYSLKPDGKGGKIDTVREAINRWAPNNENHTEGYISLVCTMLECGPDDEFDFSDPNFLFWMVEGIGTEENGEAFQTVTDAEIMEGVRRALSR